VKLSTKAIHIGQEPDPTTGATVPPIYATSTYTQEAPGRHKGFEYSRTDNPTRQGLERCLAALEGGAEACAFASGLAATDAVVASLLRPGQSIVAFSDLYGGTYRLLEQVYRPWGLDIRYTDDTDPEAFAALVDDTTRLVWLETPTNPLLRILDIAEIARAVRSKRPSAPDDPRGVLLAVDNTFASPVLQRPIEFGVDLVVHSATKYLGGHSDLVGGAVVATRAETLAPIRFHQNAAGAVPSAFDCFLIQRGLKTLALRMERHCANAKRIAGWAVTRWEFSRVLYPGLHEHPGHEIARRQMSGYGGMVSLVLAGGMDAAKQFLGATKLFACAESLGSVESLINHPAIMTHASVPPEVRRRIGIEDGLVRLSVGIEDVNDLIEDLDQALRGLERG
jgi:cystathionine beta-lyase/cystathionine gamma-synthase